MNEKVVNFFKNRYHKGKLCFSQIKFHVKLYKVLPWISFKQNI